MKNGVLDNIKEIISSEHRIGIGQYLTPQPVIDLMVSLVPLKKNDIIVDPTCGTGSYLIAASKKIKKIRLYGIDINPGIIEWANFFTDSLHIEATFRNENSLKELKKSCVDLLQVVKSNYYIPVPTYSIKKVAPYLGFSWRQKDIGAFESMVLYWDWLKSPEQKIIQKVLDYNEDDCMAMVYVDRKLFEEFV